MIAARGRQAAQFLAVSVPRFLLGALIFTGIGINFANVVGRYVFSAPIIWAEEILVFIMIWCVFVGAILVTWEGRHIKMDLLSCKLRPPWRQLVNGLAALGFVLVCVFVVIQSWGMVSMLLETGQQSVIARLPVGLMHGSILVGFTLMLLVVLLRARSYISGEFGSDAEATVRQLTETYGAGDEAAGGPPSS
jgi:TRAP-type C4-dicarboxylate transport system permease small subunit